MRAILLKLAGLAATALAAEPPSSAGGVSAALPIPAAHASDLSSFEGRRKALLETFANEGSEKFMRAACLFALGREREGNEMLNKGLDALEPGNKINRWMHGGNTGFIAWPGIDCYIRYERFIDAPTRERYRRIYTGGVFYAKLSTSNHKIMAALTRYLATQVWGPDSFKADPYFMEKDPYIQEMTGKIKKPMPGQVWGTRFTGGDESGELYLRQIIDSTVRGGPGEFASRPYGAQNVLPLLSLADCAKDKDLANRARIAYEVCLVQIAPAWLRGHLATFAPRSYPDIESQKPWGFATLPWLYFGGVSPDLQKAQAAASAAVSDFRIPPVITHAAADRSEPYFYRARINGFALNHYVNRDYALFSRSAKIGGRPWQGQSYPCGVMWEEPDATAKGSHLWITNPSADKPDEMGIHTHGVRTFEQEVLGRDALLFVFQIEEDNRFPYALGYVPGGHRAMINDSSESGRIFLHYGSVLIAVSSSERFDWNPAAGILAPASTPREGDSEFRVKAPALAIAIETARPSEFPAATAQETLNEFRKKILAKSSISLAQPKPASGTYRNRHGDVLTCVFDGEDTVNGDAINYATWPISESPWTSQKNESTLTVTDGRSVRTYDFERWSVTERNR